MAPVCYGRCSATRRRPLFFFFTGIFDRPSSILNEGSMQKAQNRVTMYRKNMELGFRFSSGEVKSALVTGSVDYEQWGDSLLVKLSRGMLLCI